MSCANQFGDVVVGVVTIISAVNYRGSFIKITVESVATEVVLLSESFVRVSTNASPIFFLSYSFLSN